MTIATGIGDGAVQPRGRPARRLEDFFAAALMICLFGYALLGKGFAYLGIPPLYLGELLLLAGLAVLLRSGCLFAVMGSAPSFILAALMGLVLCRLAIDFPLYGFDALRDSVVVMYGGFAFVAAAIVLHSPDRLARGLEAYRVFSRFFPIVAPVLLLSSAVATSLPAWPGSGLPIVSVRVGEVAAHLAGVAAFVLLGLARVGWLWSAALVVSAGCVFAQNRGGALAIAAPMLIAWLVGRNSRQVARLSVIAGVLLVLAIVAGVSVNLGGGRQLGVDQMIANVSSIFGESSTGNLDGTKQWRLRWWNAIADYTLNGDYFWSGKGLGLNLAVADGFVVGLEAGGTPLRSPHNVHLTILARLGVPGLALWVLLLVSWFLTVAYNTYAAARRGHGGWSKLFAFLGCYVLAIVIDASFDVAIEGPMLGIWFWSLLGAGIGASLLYWSRYPSRAAIRRAAIGGVLALLIAALVATGPSPSRATQKDAEGSISSVSGPCLVVSGRSDVVIENMRVGPCAGHGIEIVNSRSITVRNVTFEHTGGVGIRVLSSAYVKIERNVFIDTLSGVYALESQGLVVSCNSFVNVRGPIPRGQFVQFDKVRGPGMAVSCNIGRNEPGRSDPEDAISMYKSQGEPHSPILIERNQISGGGPSLSGGGIMLGDGGGAYLTARANILTDPGQYGIGVAGGHHMEISDNVIVARQQPFTNVGISVWGQPPDPCHSVEVRGNLVNWISKSGRPNPWWNGKTCGLVAGQPSNNFNATPVQIEQARAALRCNC